MQTYLGYSHPNAILTSYTSPCLIQPIFNSPKLLLQAIYPVVNVSPCSFDGDSLFVNQLQQLIGHDWFCRAVMFISPRPAIAAVTGCHPINQDWHGLDIRRRAIIIPWNPSFGFTCGTCNRLFWCLKNGLPQNNGPSHTSSPNIAINFLPQLGCIMLLHYGTSHFSKLSSAFRHFKRNLHLGSIWDLTEKKRMWILNSWRESKTIIQLVNWFLGH